jgi:glycosyltransferase involved in cell wall biosynthesis
LTRVLIDARWIHPGQRGIGNFTSNLISSLAVHENSDIRITISSNNNSIKELKNIFKTKFDYLILPRFSDPILDFIYFNALNLIYKFNVVHFTGNSGVIFFKKSTKVILTLHDVSFMKNEKIVPKPQRLKQLIGRMYRRLLVPFFIRKSDHVITVSKFAMNDIKNEFPWFNNVEFVYHGIDSPKYSEIINYRNDDFGVFKNKYLVISGNDPQKNLQIVIKAFSLLFDDSSNNIPELLIVGLTMSDFVKYNPDVIIKPNIIFYGYIDNKNLNYAIVSAKSIIIPSYYESFGLPLIESLFLYKKVICSNTGALGEIASNSVLYFDPYNVNSLINAINNVDNFDNNIIENWVKENKTKFSWNNVSDFYINKYLN